MGNKEIKLKCNAKINLTLEILGKRSDGYHDISSIMQSIDLSDILHVIKIKEKDIIISTDNNVLNKENNICYKTAKVFFDYCNINEGCKIFINKKIPMGAGLAGGSTDAAGTLVALDYLFNTNLKNDEKIFLSKKIGADVSFCIFGGTMLSSGIGEKLEKLKFVNKKLLIVKPSESISTKEAFALIDKEDYLSGINTEKIIERINNDNFCIYDLMINSMYHKSILLVPQMVDIVDSLENKFKAEKAMMTGSGSTIFSIFESESALVKAYEYFKNLYEDVYITRTMNESIIRI